MANNSYALYKFDDYTLAKKIPNYVKAEEIYSNLYSRTSDDLEKLHELIEDVRDMDFVGIKKTALNKITLSNIDEISKTMEIAKLVSLMENYIFEAMFHDKYKYCFCGIVHEGNDNFSRDMADVWLE